MSTAISTLSPQDASPLVPIPSTPAPTPRRLHRLAEVRRQECVTLATLAHRLGLSPEEVRQQERSNDLPLSALYAWQEALDVPVTEFLVDGDLTLSTPVLKRAQLLRMMKAVMAIVERSKQASVRRLAQLLAGQLVELMPELKEVHPPPAVGKRRTKRELGQAAFRRFFSLSPAEMNDESV